MTANFRAHRLCLSFLTLIGVALFSASADELSLVEFDSKEDGNMRWRVVNDGVMGGLSKGQVSRSRDGTLTFAGTLSLENNGGFSSVQTGPLDLDLSGYSGLAMRVKGDGRTYQVRVGSDARYRWMKVSFKADFATEKGKWTVVRVPFSEMSGTFRGRDLKDKVLNTSKIERLGLLLADEKAGPFSLEVDWIRAYGGRG